MKLLAWYIEAPPATSRFSHSPTYHTLFLFPSSFLEFAFVCGPFASRATKYSRGETNWEREGERVQPCQIQLISPYCGSTPATLGQSYHTTFPLYFSVLYVSDSTILSLSLSNTYIYMFIYVYSLDVVALRHPYSRIYHSSTASCDRSRYHH